MRVLLFLIMLAGIYFLTGCATVQPSIETRIVRVPVAQSCDLTDAVPPRPALPIADLDPAATEALSASVANDPSAGEALSAYISSLDICIARVNALETLINSTSDNNKK